MITVNDIAVEFGGTTLFSDVTFAINENDKTLAAIYMISVFAQD